MKSELTSDVFPNISQHQPDAWLVEVTRVTDKNKRRNKLQGVATSVVTGATAVLWTGGD